MSPTHSILVLVAGNNHPSNSETLADACIEGMKKTEGVEIEKIRVDLLKLDHFTLAHYDEKTDQGEDFLRLQKLITESAGILIATPMWNFSVPAHLKNLIDRIGSFALDKETRSKGTLKGKPCAFIITGGAPWPAWTGLMKKTISHLPESMRYFGATPVATHFEPKCTKGKGMFGLVVDQRPESLEKVRAMGKEFAEVVKRYGETGTLPAKDRLMQMAYGWGKAIMKRL